MGSNVVVGPLRGAQGTLGLNVVTSSITGAQLAVGINYAHGTVAGMQAASVNYAKGHVSGVQLGLMNIAQSSNLQIGLINIADETRGTSLGLINYARKDGILDLKLFTSDIALGGIALELGNRYAYTGFSFITGTWTEESKIGVGLHLGARIYASSKVEVNIEAGSQWMLQDSNESFEDSALINSLKLDIGYRFNSKFLLFAGPALHVLIDGAVSSGTRSESKIAPNYAFRFTDESNDANFVYLWPGFITGLRIL